MCLLPKCVERFHGKNAKKSCGKNSGRWIAQKVCVNHQGWAVIDPLAKRSEIKLASSSRKLTCNQMAICKYGLQGLATFACTAAVGAATLNPMAAVQAGEFCGDLTKLAIKVGDDSNYSDTSSGWSKALDAAPDLIGDVVGAGKALKVAKAGKKALKVGKMVGKTMKLVVKKTSKAAKKIAGKELMDSFGEKFMEGLFNISNNGTAGLECGNLGMYVLPTEVTGAEIMSGGFQFKNTKTKTEIENSHEALEKPTKRPTNKPTLEKSLNRKRLSSLQKEGKMEESK